MVEIRIVKGPLSKELLEYVTQLYGKIDKKYASIDYCNYLYNENPFGFSYHAFAYANDTPVGHIALIPMQIVTSEGLKNSFKSESFYLESEYRDNWITYIDDELPLGLAMPKVINDFALKDNYKVIHLLADDEIGKIHRYSGCIRIPILVKESFLIVNEAEYVRRESKIQRKMLISIIAAWQKTISFIIGCSRPVFSKNSCLINTIDDSKLIVQAVKINSSDQWTIAFTPEYQSWLAKSPFIRICKYNNTDDDYIVFKQSEYPHRITEIIGCYSKNNNYLKLIKILQCIKNNAEDRQASSVNLKHFPNQELPKALIKALQLSGFMIKKTKLSCFVKSFDKEYLQKDNLAYTAFFYIQF